MTRGKRIALELLGPPFLGTVVLYAGSGVYAIVRWVQSGNPPGWNPAIFGAILGVLVFAYPIAGIPSIVYTLAMEWRFARGLKPDTWRTVRYSAVLGFLSGAAIGGVFRGNLSVYLAMSGIGTVVGFVLGFLIKVLSSGEKPEGGRPV